MVMANCTIEMIRRHCGRNKTMRLLVPLVRFIMESPLRCLIVDGKSVIVGSNSDRYGAHKFGVKEDQSYI